MIKVDFPEPSTPTWKRWRKDCEKATQELLAAVAAGKPVEINDQLYRRGSIKRELYFAKNGPFCGKCAYCECWITDFQHGDIEHFRPKKAVTDIDDQPILVSDGTGSAVTEHLGYYWLAYEWRNLLPSCQSCNQPNVARDGVSGQERRIGKRNRFPVQGKRAWQPGHDLAEEQPLLINPIEEEPSAHLAVDSSNGIMLPKSPRGQACIDVFGLNVRDRLPEDRLSAIDGVRAILVQHLHSVDPKQKRDCMEKLTRIKRGQEGKHTLAARAFLEKYATDVSSLGSGGS